MQYRIDYAITDIDSVLQRYEVLRPEDAGLEKELKEIQGNKPRKKKRGYAALDSYELNELEIENLKKIRDVFYESAVKFFKTEDINQWTAELDALKGEDPDFKTDDDRGLKNDLSLEAFLSIIYGSGYVMARAVVNGEAEKLKAFSDRYPVRIIDV